MKRLLAVSLSFNAALLAGLLWKEVSVHAQGGGGVPKGNGDVNGDGSIDISDAIYLLTSLFLGGKDPVAIEYPPCPPDLSGQVQELEAQVNQLQSDLRACSAARKGLPATGQTKCHGSVEGQDWTEVPCDQAAWACQGQDGFYQAGCPKEGRFVDNGDGTVSDNCTGLMWQKDTADVNGDGVIDPQWDGGDSVSWWEALAFSESLSFAGHTDWRLPNVRELESIVDYGIDPAMDPVFGALPPNTSYWSSTRFAGTSHGAWCVDFVNGSVQWWGVDVQGNPCRRVRAVRGIGTPPATGQSKCYDEAGNEIACDGADFSGQDGFYQSGCSSEGRLVDNGDGTVTDNCTGLMWQKDTADVNGDGEVRPGFSGGDAVPWCAALAYCENLSFAGHDDWRLPNVRELQSIVDYGRLNPAIDPAFGAFSECYYSSMSIADCPECPWIVCFEGGGAGVGRGDGMDGQHLVRAVRNAP